MIKSDMCDILERDFQISKHSIYKSGKIKYGLDDRFELQTLIINPI